MADALLSAVASTILTNLNSLAHGEFAIAGGFRIELNNLKSTFTTIKAVLYDAEEKQWKDEAIKDWLRKLKDAFYEVDDLLDEFAVHAQKPTDLKSRVRFFASLENPIVFRLKMAHKMKSIRQKLDAIASEKNNFHLKEVVIEDRGGGVPDWRKTTSLVNESEIIGREKEKEELISMLMTNSEHLSVYAVCGMGGLGKTTLSQLVYNDEKVEKHFDLRIWVCVSDNFDLMRLTKAILESIQRSTPNIQELDPLQRELQEKLNGRKFLLVLDDVWNEDPDKWDGLKNAIRCGAKGSVVIVTTRNEKIALMMSTKPIHFIGRLSDDDSWSLFEQRAFGSGRKEELLNLETIGRDIIKKCGGVPLAIKAMGSLMCLKRKESEWLSIKESETWELLDEGSLNILPALRLSYNHLAPHLKQCFAFCSLFPKDYVMEKDKLIGLWMANGFIPCKGQVDLHDKGQQIFDELVWRSFFQDVEEDLLGNATCKMHDLVHDLAQSIMKDECKLIEANQIFKVSKMVRHLSLHQLFPPSNNLFKDQSLRSFLCFGSAGSHQQAVSYFFSGQKHLRVLGLSNSDLNKLPISIERLKHLRYLDFSHSSMESLPESTTTLQNLQTLNLRGCWLYKLPDDMKNMKSLMYLDITNCGLLSYMPAEMGKLSHLRKLSKFIVGKDKGHSIRELKELNLEGQLSIEKLECVKSYTDAKNANLMQKKDLKSLQLYWLIESAENYNQLEQEDVLDGLQPRSNLKKLSIRNYKGSKFPNWMMELILPNLVEMHLVDCDRCEHLPPFGKLKFLKILELNRMGGVKCIGNEIYGPGINNGETSFPSLESLSLRDMGGLEEWATAGGRRDLFPVLRRLAINSCPKLVEMPIIPSVKILDLLEVSEILIRPVQYFTSLTTVRLDMLGSQLTHLPDGLLENHIFLKDLEIEGWNSLKSLSNQLHKLSALKRLTLSNCKELESIPEDLWSLNSLETLEIYGCGIKSFPPPFNGVCSDLSSLHNLMIYNCSEFGFLSEGVRHLTTLESLSLSDCPKLNSLPESIGHITALRNLRISYCKGLSSLPNGIGNLVSLSRLEIDNCPNLVCLPDEIRNLKMLSHLTIRNCPDLQRRCKKDTGEDMPKIAHIPFIDNPMP